MFTGSSNIEALAYILWAPRMKQESWEKTLMHGKINDNKKGTEDTVAGSLMKKT